MPEFAIYFDHLHEGEWFQGLASDFVDAQLLPLARRGGNPDPVDVLLRYDRPDVILTADDVPVLVIERSEEVPTGHNVGQRFGRIVAAAEARVPFLYVFPFAAFKHGGETRGPRYVNLRLFEALTRLELIHETFILSMNWPVDDRFELLRDPTKDDEVKLLLSQVLEHLPISIAQPDMLHSIPAVAQARSAIAEELMRKATKNPEYNSPPASVQVGVQADTVLEPEVRDGLLPRAKCCIYQIGMKYMRSDPYTGNLMLYDYLYTRLGKRRDDREMHLVAWMPNIPLKRWRVLARRKSRKDIAIFSTIPDALILADAQIGF